MTEESKKAAKNTDSLDASPKNAASPATDNITPSDDKAKNSALEHGSALTKNDNVKNDRPSSDVTGDSLAKTPPKHSTVWGDAINNVTDVITSVFKILPGTTVEIGESLPKDLVVTSYPQLEKTIAESIAHLDKPGQHLVKKAYAFANYWHAKQSNRATGEPYICHPVEVAFLISKYKVDASSIAAAVLHDVHEDHPVDVPLEDITKYFGADVSHLVNGLTKIAKASSANRQAMKDKDELFESLHRVAAGIGASFRSEISANAGNEIPWKVMSEFTEGLSAEQKEAYKKVKQEAAKAAKIKDKASTLNKLFMSMASDIRIILIKLVDRLHNMKTLGGLLPEKQRRIAKETADIFVPIANRLGVWDIKYQLEDLTFSYLEPEKYRQLTVDLASERAARAKKLEATKEIIRKLLAEKKIKAQVSSREKHIYSTYLKMDRLKRKLSEIYDIDAIYITCSNRNLCYSILGYIRDQFTVLPGRNKDYIGTPKSNCYRAIHETISGKGDQAFEVQICTTEDSLTNDFGAFQKLKVNKSKSSCNISSSSYSFDEYKQWTQALLTFANPETGDNIDNIDKIKHDYLTNDVYALTPQGKVIDLPSGAKPVDFAYRVHTNLGDTCVAAYVNQENVSIADYVIRSGDVIAIISSDTANPSREWYDKCATTMAKSCISKFLAKEDPEVNIGHGKKLAVILLAEVGREILAGDAAYMESLAKYLKYDSLNDMYCFLGSRTITNTVFKRAAEHTAIKYYSERSKEYHQNLAKGSPKFSTMVKAVAGFEDIVAGRTNKCCFPVKGDVIYGVLPDKGKKVIVHVKGCHELQKASQKDPERIIQMEWVEGAQEDYYTTCVFIRLVGDVRRSLSKEVIDVFDNNNVYISEYHFYNHKAENRTKISIKVSVKNGEHLQLLFDKLLQVKGIQKVSREDICI